MTRDIIAKDLLCKRQIFELTPECLRLECSKHVGSKCHRSTVINRFSRQQCIIPNMKNSFYIILVFHQLEQYINSASDRCHFIASLFSIWRSNIQGPATIAFGVCSCVDENLHKFDIRIRSIYSKTWMHYRLCFEMLVILNVHAVVDAWSVRDISN